MRPAWAITDMPRIISVIYGGLFFCSWVTCTECGHVIELTGETLDLTSRVSGLKEMVKKLKKENEELCLQNENFNVQLSTSRSQLLQLNHKLNTTGHQLTIYKRGNILLLSSIFNICKQNNPLNAFAFLRLFANCMRRYVNSLKSSKTFHDQIIANLP